MLGKRNVTEFIKRHRWDDAYGFFKMFDNQVLSRAEYGGCFVRDAVSKVNRLLLFVYHPKRSMYSTDIQKAISCDAQWHLAADALDVPNNDHSLDDLFNGTAIDSLNFSDQNSLPPAPTLFTGSPHAPVTTSAPLTNLSPTSLTAPQSSSIYGAFGFPSPYPCASHVLNVSKLDGLEDVINQIYYQLALDPRLEPNKEWAEIALYWSALRPNKHHVRR